MSTLGVDVGGTFTDFVALTGDGWEVFKCLTTPRDPSVGVIEGAKRLSEARRLSLSEFQRIIHGTTLVANSLIERRGSRTAMVTTSGFRDVIEIAKEARYDIYDLALERPEPLVPRPLRLEINERTAADGTVLQELDEADAVAVVEQLLSLEVDSVAVCFLHSYANPANERCFGEIAAREAPALDVTLSADVAPEWREYERGSTTCANAFVRPLVKRYLTNLESELAKLDAPDRLYVVLSQGGVTSWEIAADRPIQLVESGPAGGVMAAAHFGRLGGFDNVIGFDMGGTTAKISLIEEGEPVRVSELEVARVARFKRGSGLPLKVPAIELIEIGAGGGSIARQDALGLLKVGPESAGAEPGPACYARGGLRPTVTDADLVLGLLNPSYFLGGEMALDSGAAQCAIASLGRHLALEPHECARGIFDIVNQQMALAMQTHVAERGSDPRRFALLASGGAGPVHAYEVARHLGITTVIAPPIAGVASALGFLVSPFSIDLSRTYRSELGKMDWHAIGALLKEMEREAHSLLSRAGSPPGDIEYRWRADMRYVGQGSEVTVDVVRDPSPVEAEDQVEAAFHVAYAKQYGQHLLGAACEVLNWRLTARAPSAGLDDFGTPPSSPRRSASAETALKGHRLAFFPEAGQDVSCPVLDRYVLRPGATVAGPILVEERETTTVIGPAGEMSVDDVGNLVIKIRPQ